MGRILAHLPINLDEELIFSPEPFNPHNNYAIGVFKNKTIVGHVLKEISWYWCCALNSGGKMRAYTCR